MADKKFIDGLIVKAPHEKAPDFVKFSLSIKVHEFEAFLRDNRDGEWMNIQVKESKGGKLYAELDTWKPQGRQQEARQERPQAIVDDFDDSIPF